MTIETSERSPYAPRWSNRDKQQQQQQQQQQQRMWIFHDFRLQHLDIALF
jgi:hypothetical protein